MGTGKKRGRAFLLVALFAPFTLFEKTPFAEQSVTASLSFAPQTERAAGREKFYLARSARSSEKRRRVKRSPAFASPRKEKPLKGLSVGTVKKGHLLYRLGLRTGDVIEQINGRRISSKRSFFALLKRSRAGEKNLLKIQRKGKRRTLYYIVEMKGGPPFRRTYRAVRRGDEMRLRTAVAKVPGQTARPAAEKAAGERRPGAEKATRKRRKRSPARALSSKTSQGDSLPKEEKEALRKTPFPKTADGEKAPAPRGKAGKSGKALSQTQADKAGESKGRKDKGGGRPVPPSPPDFDRLSKKEKSLLAAKSKYLQKAYVLQMNSQIYEKPNFDALPVYTVPAGGKILISRKIFTPPSKFGTFYKIFIHKNKKIVGYISEIDVVPRFERSGKKINPRYAVLRAQMKKGRGPGEEALLKPERWPEPSNSRRKKKAKTRFAGLSLLVKWDGKRNLRSFFGGVKFSGEGILSDSLNMDINLMSDMKRESFRFDILGIYNLLKGRGGGGSLHLGGGLEMTLERATGSIFPGLIGSAGLRLALLTGVFWQNEFRASWTFDLSKEAVEDGYGFLTSLQFRF